MHLRRRRLALVTGLVAPGLCALAASAVHAFRFIACLDEIGPVVTGAWAFVSLLVTVPSAALAGLLLRFVPVDTATDVAHALGWANMVSCVASLSATCFAVTAHDRNETLFFGVMAAVALLVGVWCVRAARRLANGRGVETSPDCGPTGSV